MSAVSSTSEWTTENTIYLQKLSTTSGLLSQRFMFEYHRLLKMERYFKLPVIFLSSVSGLLSALNTSVENTLPISITITVLSLIVTTTNSSEGYLRLGDNIQKSIETSKALSSLKEMIDVELSLKVEDRNNDSVLFLKEAYGKYNNIMEMCPPLLKNNRYILDIIDKNLTITDNRKQSDVIIIRLSLIHI